MTGTPTLWDATLAEDVPEFEWPDVVDDPKARLASLRAIRDLGFVVLPYLNEAVFQHIDLVRMGDKRVLSVFVTRSGLVNTRMLHVDEEIDQDRLDKMVRYLDDVLGGLTLTQVKQQILEQGLIL